ncbi:Iron/zinc purple acid phosphatase-like protein [Stylophora pistillata]|uniref:Iron/zinc purple acid phosphatase-like protein n=1 Tax=Stylophora pistillata TaxID=50429 RepID=A0A2B4RMF1_STYPI|nr:Iron/zinc purple acid phosphatase-like protein [Stylophora pistillata]
MVLVVLQSGQGVLASGTPQPEQIHISSTGDPTEMMITWVTMAESVKSVVEYGERLKLPLNKKAFGSATKYKACGWKKRIIYMHRVKLEELTPGSGYEEYNVKSYFQASLFASSNFSNYRERFSMPGNTEGIYYSWNIGPVHIISFSTELYYFLEYGMEPLVRQYKWLQRDLEIRTGLSSAKLFPLEDLLYRHGVDVEFWAHEHSYERLYPVYDHEIRGGSKEQPYTNPRAPVHITTGSAGCKYCHDKFQRDYGPWTAFRSLDYGYTRVQVFNSSHMSLEQVSIDKDYQVIDRIWIIKDKHGPEAWKGEEDNTETSAETKDEKVSETHVTSVE